MRRQAFTLVELLVVVAVIALLISILLPALKMARATAQSVACMSNQRQCVLGVEIYTHDHRGVMAAYQIMGGGYHYWLRTLVAGYNTGPGSSISHEPYVDRAVSLCPSNSFYASDRKTDPKSKATWLRGYGYYRADVSDADQFQTKLQFTASKYNNYLLTHRLTNIGTLPMKARVKGSGPWKTFGTPMPANVVMLTDSYSSHGHFPPGHMVGIFMPHDNGSYINGVHMLHTDGKANAAFYDGHVQTLDDQAMRHDTWSKAENFYDKDGGYYEVDSTD